MRKFRGSFRSRRRFRPPGKGPGGTKKVWINKLFSAIQGVTHGSNEFADIFELVAAEDYTDPTSLTQKIEYATVVRSVGALEVDLAVEAPGANGILWSACIFARSQTAVIAEFTLAPTAVLFFIHPESPSTTNQASHLARLQPLAWLPMRSWTGAFRENEAAAGCSDFFSDINRPAQSEPWYFDVRQRRRLHSDMSLWLLVSGIYICDVNDGSPVFNTVYSRTLIHDD